MSGWLDGIGHAKRQFEATDIKGMIDLSKDKIGLLKMLMNKITGHDKDPTFFVSMNFPEESSFSRVTPE